MDVIGNDYVDHPEFHRSERITFIDIGGMRQGASFLARLFQLTVFYVRLIWCVTVGAPKVVHILWNNRVEYFDRTLLMLYYKLVGKKVVLTAHNVNKAKRDASDSALNRLTLRIQYSLSDHVFVHTEKMKRELIEEFAVPASAVTVIPFGINIAVPDSGVTINEAKQRLGIRATEHTILFFGRIVPYKGLEYLVEAFQRVAGRDLNCRLIIAGQPMKGFEKYAEGILLAIERSAHSDRIQRCLEFIPDDQTELYFKAADVLALPYKNSFESGVLYLAYRFGLPVIASDVGSFREEMAKSGAGLVFEPGDSADLGDTIEAFFESELYRDATRYRRHIREYASARHSWDELGEITEAVYRSLRSNSAAPSPASALQREKLVTSDSSALEDSKSAFENVKS